MSNLGTALLLHQMEVSEQPQLICGRVVPIKEEFYQAPASGKACVYYQTVLEELVDKTEGNMLETAADVKDKVWVMKACETRKGDLELVDPNHLGHKLYVPAGRFHMTLSDLEDDLNGRAKGNALVLTERNINPRIRALLERFGIVFDHNKHLNKLRLREACLEYAEQAAVMGIVRDVTDPVTGVVNKVLFPVSDQILTDHYFSTKQITGWSKQALLDICKEPCFIATSNQNHFKGVVAGKLKKKMVCATYVNIDHALPSAVPASGKVER